MQSNLQGAHVVFLYTAPGSTGVKSGQWLWHGRQIYCGYELTMESRDGFVMSV